MAATPRFPLKPPTATGERAAAGRGPEYVSKDAVIEAIGTLGRSIDHRLVNMEKGQEELRQGQKALECGQKALEGGQKALEGGQKALESRMSAVEVRLDRVETRLDRVEMRLDRVETRLDQVDTRLDRLEVGQDTIIRVMNDNHAELNRKIELILATISAQPR